LVLAWASAWERKYYSRCLEHTRDTRRPIRGSLWAPASRLRTHQAGQNRKLCQCSEPHHMHKNRYSLSGRNIEYRDSRVRIAVALPELGLIQKSEPAGLLPVLFQTEVDE